MSLEEHLKEVLDDKLEKILSKQIYAPEGGGRLFFQLHPTIAQIKQAFKDEGWQPPGGGLRGNLVTGQEWYDRFEKQLSDDTYGDSNPTNKCDCDGVPYICTCDLLEAAKKAAGLEDAR